MKIKGLKKVSGETKSLKGYYSAKYLQLNFNKETHEIWTDEFYSLGHNSWQVYEDENIVKICNLTEPTTMKELKEIIENYENEVW